MHQKSLKEIVGEEYPKAFTQGDGIRLPLVKETRFLRHFAVDYGRLQQTISRFWDGSATVTLSELQRDWQSLPYEEQADLGQAIYGFAFAKIIPKDMVVHPELVDFLKFLMESDNSRHWAIAAPAIPILVPPVDAIGLLRNHLSSNGPSIFIHAISDVKHPLAASTLGDFLEQLWNRPDILSPTEEPQVNLPAQNAMLCIWRLLEMGEAPERFEEKARLLLKHPNASERHQCANLLYRHYGWMAKPLPWSWT